MTIIITRFFLIFYVVSGLNISPNFKHIILCHAVIINTTNRILLENFTHRKKTTHPSKSGNSSVTYVVVGVLCFIVIVAAAVVLTVFYRIRKALWLNKELAKKCKILDSYTNSEQLLQTTEYLLQSEDIALKFLMKNINTGNYFWKITETIDIATCNDPTIPCLSRTSVNLNQPSKYPKLLLNVNAVHDFFMSPIYLGQTPTPCEFEEFWQAIDELHINVVVCMVNGKFVLDEYHIPIKQIHVPEKYGAYSVRNTNVLSFRSKDLIIYELEYVRGRKFVGERARKLYFFKVVGWPFESGTQPDPENLILLIEKVDEYRQKQFRSIPNSNANGIMVQCKNGTEQSATFVALFIGRQMWQFDSQINPIGIMRYINSCRYGAFVESKSPGKQLQLVYSALLYIIKNNRKKLDENDDKENGLAKNSTNQTNLAKTPSSCKC